MREDPLAARWMCGQLVRFEPLPAPAIAEPFARPHAEILRGRPGVELPDPFLDIGHGVLLWLSEPPSGAQIDAAAGTC